MTFPENRYPLLTTEQAAALLGLKPRALESWRYRGCGPIYVRVSARSIRYRKSDLDAWIEEHLRTSTSDDGRGTSAARPGHKSGQSRETGETRRSESDTR